MRSRAHPGWLRAAGPLILTLILARAASAQLGPEGAYRSGSLTLDLRPDGQLTLAGPAGILGTGTYRIVRDNIVVRDDHGPSGCAGEVGRYSWVRSDSLRLRVVTDFCGSRRSLLARAWARAIVSQQLDEIVVTGPGRRPEDVQRAPVSVSVVSGDDARDARVNRPEDLMPLVPGLVMGTLNGSAPMFYLRGVGNFAGTSTQDPTVTFNFDGVYIARPTSTGGFFYDLERVEVLKGPQGTLYGRNATGGAIEVLPRRPELQVVSAAVAAEYGSHGTLRVDGGFNAPLGSRAAMRIAAQRVRHESYMRDGTDDQDDWGARLTLRFEPTEKLSLRVGADLFDQGGHGPGATPVAPDLDPRAGVTSAEGASYYATKRVTIAGRNWEGLPSIQRTDNRHWGLNATLEWQTGLGGLTVVPATRSGDLDALNTAVGNLFTQKEHNRQHSLEARLLSHPLPRLHTLVGGFLFDEAVDLFTRPYNLFNFSLQHPVTNTTSAAAFGRVTWDITSRLRATAGARYTHESKDIEGTFEGFSRVCPVPPTANCPTATPFPVGIDAAPLTFPAGSTDATPVFNPAEKTLTTGFRIVSNESATFSRTTWRAALEYDLTDRVFLYGSYETGFKSGGFFFSNDSQVYQPEHVNALTFGVKTRFFDSRLQANLELFDWRYRDQQVSRIALDSRLATTLRTDNIGKATIRGAEADVDYLLSGYTRLTGSLQYLDAVYDAYTFVNFGLPPSGCPTESLGQNQFQVNCSGRRAPYAPEWTIGFGGEQVVQLPGRSSLTTRARARYQSETLVGLDFRPDQQQPGYWMVDASLSLGLSNDRYTVGLFGQNLTNKTTLSNTFVVPFSTFVVGALRPPRTIGVRVSLVTNRHPE